ncbi:hypothetical protein MY11210_007810 [Beauveria gryllotalpidicola]
MTIVHIVLFKFRPEVSDDLKATFVEVKQLRVLNKRLIIHCRWAIY